MSKIIKRQKTTEGNVKRVATTITSPLNSNKSVVYTKEKEKGTRSGNVTMRHKFTVKDGDITSFKSKLSEGGKNKHGNKVMSKSKEKGSLNPDGLYSVKSKSKRKNNISGEVEKYKNKNVVKREKKISNALNSLRYK